MGLVIEHLGEGFGEIVFLPDRHHFTSPSSVVRIPVLRPVSLCITYSVTEELPVLERLSATVSRWTASFSAMELVMVKSIVSGFHLINIATGYSSVRAWRTRSAACFSDMLHHLPFRLTSIRLLS